MRGGEDSRGWRRLAAQVCVISGAVLLVVCGIALSAPTGSSRVTNRAVVYPLVADPGGPYNVERGGTVQLDGSKSKPSDQIKSYRWTFRITHCPAGVQLRAAAKQGSHTAIVALCSIRATLTVSDGKARSNSKSTDISVSARELKKIPFAQDHDATVKMPFAHPVLAFGLNRSVEVWSKTDKAEPFASNDRWLDPGDRSKAVELKRVSDPGGPFDRFWYVVGHRLKVDRVIILNKKLLPGGGIWQINSHHRGALAELVAATRRHEQIHGTLVQNALKSGKIALSRLEQAIGSSKAQLQGRTHFIIGEAETTLKNVSSEANVHSAMHRIYGSIAVKILVPGSSGDNLETFVLATLGDAGGGH
jgi:hypothetical protein